MDIQSVQQFYNEYAFIDSDGTAEAKPSAGEAVSEAISLWTQHRDHMEALAERTYEKPYKWYYVVFKPFNLPYERDKAWYEFKGLDACRKYFKRPKVAILSREIQAEKIHINALVCTDQFLKHGYSNRKYKLGVYEIHDIDGRRRTLKYLLKESGFRSFKLYLDYIFNPKN